MSANVRPPGADQDREAVCSDIRVYFLLAPETYFAIAERSRELGLPFVGHIPALLRAADASDAGQHSIEPLTSILSGCSTDEAAILADVITNTQRICAVVAGGRLYRRADLDRLLADVEALNQQESQRE